MERIRMPHPEDTRRLLETTYRGLTRTTTRSRCCSHRERIQNGSEVLQSCGSGQKRFHQRQGAAESSVFVQSELRWPSGAVAVINMVGGGI
ncbi:hypothetical protein Q3G72_001918 [Acer saccharum]|nr:hypothetical protein Q3G72_001918 [Acer saccharum]